ncbi:hypothetical protein J2Y03_004194 [Neobacillus niacini]|uniref:hypothetical protein n=1 Tax=Neobacillus niacini TaxID=86668 RepID=UPI0028666E13|nr:hypothetical protein [Neobacillus niacini]MDR7079137.1 hypothetical protein [Neobacillus niacini]
MNKKWVIVTIMYSFLFSMLIILFNFAVDPLHYYRSNNNKGIYWSEERWQLPGLAKNYNYNTMILGTSMTENFVPSEVNAIFPGAKTLKLSLAGSSTYEQSKIARIAFNHKNVENVIWGIDYTSLGKENSFTEEFPKFLYDTNKINDLKYLLNITTTKYSITSILYNISPNLVDKASPIISLNDYPETDLNRLNYWGDLFTFNKEIVLEDYYKKIKQDRDDKKELLNNFDLNRLKSNFDKNILPIVKNNPDTEFYFYYPPYSILMNKRFYELDPSIINNIIKSREYMYSKISNYPNAKLFDFTTDKKITFNLDNYKDTMHHSPEISEYILKSFQDDKYLITNKKLEFFLKEYKNQIKEFSMEQIHYVIKD